MSPVAGSLSRGDGPGMDFSVRGNLEGSKDKLGLNSGGLNGSDGTNAIKQFLNDV